MARKTTLLDARGRRTLLWTLMFFFAIQQISGLLLDYCWREVRFYGSAYVFGKWQSTRGRADILLFGSSRFTALDMAAIHDGLREAGTNAQVFNGSIGAGDLVTSEYMLRQLMQRGASPKLVVLEISPETVTHSNRWILEHLRRQLTWKDLPRFFPDICREGQLMRLIQARLLPLYMHRQAIWKTAWKPVQKMIATHEEVEAPPLTTRATAPELHADPGNFPEEAATTFLGLAEELPRWLHNYDVGAGTSEVALERLLSRCRKRGIQVLLVGVPVASAHRAMYTPAIEAAFKNYVARFIERDFCAFVDCRDQVPDSLFRDHHHLGPEGAAYFGRRLAKEVLAPYCHLPPVTNKS